MQSLPFLPALQPLATTNLLSVSMDLPLLDISDQWNRTVCGLLRPASSVSIMFSRVLL